MTEVYVVFKFEVRAHGIQQSQIPVATFESKEDAKRFIEDSNNTCNAFFETYGFITFFDEMPIPFTPASKATTVTAQQFNELYMGTFKKPPTFTNEFVGGTPNLPVIKVTLEHFESPTMLKWEGTGSSKAAAKQEAINLAMKYFENIFR